MESSNLTRAHIDQFIEQGDLYFVVDCGEPRISRRQLDRLIDLKEEQELAVTDLDAKIVEIQYIRSLYDMTYGRLHEKIAADEASRKDWNGVERCKKRGVHNRSRSR